VINKQVYYHKKVLHDNKRSIIAKQDLGLFQGLLKLNLRPVLLISRSSTLKKKKVEQALYIKLYITKNSASLKNIFHENISIN
jgi:hypothetical protein